MTSLDPNNHPSADQTTQPGQETHNDNPIEEWGIPLSDIPARRLRWLWPNRIPRGKLTILEGEPGVGKSLFTLDLAARITTGRPMPDGSPGIQGNVILIAPEDNIANTIRPRFNAAGGDPSRIRLLSYVNIDERISIFTLPAYLPILEVTIKDTHAVLVIIDPLTAVLAPGTNVASERTIERVLVPLAACALQTGCSILIVHYHHKGSFDNLLYASGGSMGIIASARTSLLMLEHPSDAEMCILATTRNNFSAKASNLTYQVVGNAKDIPSIRWLGTNHTPIASILKKGGPIYRRPSPERQSLFIALEASHVPLSPKELAMQTGHNHTLVKQMLRRMLYAGEILSPYYGLYTTRDRPLTGTPIPQATSPAALTASAPVNSSAQNLANTPAAPTTPATLTTPAPVSSSAQNLTNTPAAPTPPTPLTTPAPVNSSAQNLANTPAAPTPPTTPATPAPVSPPDPNVTVPPITLEHNTRSGATPPTPSTSSIPPNEVTSTPPASFETTIEKLKHLLHCSYKDHYLHWTFSINKIGCPICDNWMSKDANFNSQTLALYAILTRYPLQPGESNSTWIKRIAPLLL